MTPPSRSCAAGSAAIARSSSAAIAGGGSSAAATSSSSEAPRRECARAAPAATAASRAGRPDRAGAPGAGRCARRCVRRRRCRPARRAAARRRWRPSAAIASWRRSRRARSRRGAFSQRAAPGCPCGAAAVDQREQRRCGLAAQRCISSRLRAWRRQVDQVAAALDLQAAHVGQRLALGVRGISSSAPAAAAQRRAPSAPTPRDRHLELRAALRPPARRRSATAAGA